ncbi:MAG: hypothetical protein ABSC33_06870 [Candidatus Sulfotelmatobacter sp.]
MIRTRFCRLIRIGLLVLLQFASFAARGQDAAKISQGMRFADPGGGREKGWAEWFLHGRVVPSKSAAELRRHAYQAKMQARAVRLARSRSMHADSAQPTSSGGWMPLGPVPLASDATGDGFQDYHQVSGRATAVAIDPADPTGNMVYVAGAQGGIWKSANAATPSANDVTWTPLTDDQPTLSIGAIAIQPGNTNPNASVILAATGEADNAADSYFGLGILQSTDAGNTWTLISTANGGAYSFSGLGGTRMAFSTTTPNTVVAAMATTNVGIVDGALTANSYPGLYTSTNAGQSWTYDALSSGGTSEATSATSVIYNAAAGLFFAAVRYQGFFSSPDGLTWTRLSAQPGAPGLLSTTACPQNYVTTCPIYRGEITVVPGRNEMYAWFISLDVNNNPVDQGIWQSFNGGASWVSINDSGIINCGDLDGCGVENGAYNLELLAVPDCLNGTQTCPGNPTDLYAGAVNIYKCSIISINPTCAAAPFLNLTHAYGCDPLGAPAHVNPAQHALAFSMVNSGSSSATDLMYFANDGGIYRALDGFTGLTTGSCSGANAFDDLNQNLGSMTQFVSFSQSPSNAQILLGGTQGTGSPATATGSPTNLAWGNVLSGDGGYNAIDPNTGDSFASNPDTGLGSLNIQECSSGIDCDDSLFNVVVSSSDLGGDDGAFYFPYILDPQSNSTMLIGTCRVWSGPRTGGQFTELSLNFDTFGTGTCTGEEVNVIRALAAGGPANANGSQVIYATTDGPGPSNLGSPTGGNVWVTTNAMAVSGTSSTFSNTTLNGPGGSSINPNQFPISSVALDTSDSTGNTAYVTVTGFTGGPGLVWQTTSGGAGWTDFTGAGSANPLPDDPVNAVVVDPATHIIYVGTDVGVFQSFTSSPSWTEVGPAPSLTATGFLPDVPVTALSIFTSGCQKLLRASTYGRGIWEFVLPLSSGVPDFCLSEPIPFPTVNAGSSNTQGSITITSANGFNGSINLTCSLASGNGSCSMNPPLVNLPPLTATATANAIVNAANLAAGSYQLSVQATSGSITSNMVVPFNVADYQLTGTQSLTINAGAQGTANLTITPTTFYVGSVNASCDASALADASCNVSPANPLLVNAGVAVPISVTITVASGAAPGLYNMTVATQDTSGNPNHSLTIGVTVPASIGTGTSNAFQLATTQAFPAAEYPGAQTSAKVSVTSNYSGSVTASCDASAFAGQCSVTPENPVSISTGKATILTLTVNIPNSAAPQSSNAYNASMTVADSSGQPSQTVTLPLTVVQDYSIGDFSQNGPISVGQSVTYNLNVVPVGAAYGNQVTLTCTIVPIFAGACTFSSNLVGPLNNGTASSVVMTVTTQTASSWIFLRGWKTGSWVCVVWLAVLSIIFYDATPTRRRIHRAGVVFALLLVSISCGGGSNGGSTPGGSSEGGTLPGTYTITVTGTPASLSQPAGSSVTLIVQ